MYSASKSVPRGYEYLSARYSRKNKYKTNVLQDLPPPLYFHQEKSYFNSSPIRSKKMLVEARKYKSPLSENEKTLNPFQTKYQNLFGTITNFTNKSKLCNNKLIKKCKENIKKVLNIKIH
jgi:hypothetical protein